MHIASMILYAESPDRYGTDEFEVTTERLGCYQPTEHIDNPKGYGDGVDGRGYDRRLRGPVDERRELSIDHRTGMTLCGNNAQLISTRIHPLTTRL